MRFEERELKPYAEPISDGDLIEGGVYFLVNFIDDDMLIPQMLTITFIGKDLEKGDNDSYHFQDASSYKDGVRFGSENKDDVASYYKCSINELKGIYDFEHALEILMCCSLRRREKHFK